MPEFPNNKYVSGMGTLSDNYGDNAAQADDALIDLLNNKGGAEDVSKLPEAATNDLMSKVIAGVATKEEIAEFNRRVRGPDA